MVQRSIKIHTTNQNLIFEDVHSWWGEQVKIWAGNMQLPPIGH